jgi:transposase
VNYAELLKAVENFVPELGLFGRKLYDLIMPFVKFLQDEIQRLNERLQIATTELELLRKENKELKDKQGTNSSNSSKPPSQDPNRPKKERSQRGKTEKQPGGQPGHKGQGGHLSAAPTNVHEYNVEICPECQVDLKNVAPDEVIVRQVEDIPKVESVFDEYRIQVKTCPKCNKTWKGEGCPEHIIHDHQYGPNTKAFALVLSSVHMIPVLRVKEILSVMGLHHISPGTLSNFQKAASKRLNEKFIPLLKNRIINASRGHFDETSSVVNKKNHWVHVAATLLLCHYGIHKNRGTKAMEDIGILPHFKGVAHTDCLSAYKRFKQFIKSLCNAHIIRELQGAIDRNAEDKEWATALRKLLLDAKDIVEASEEQILDPILQKSVRIMFLTYLADGLELNPELERTPNKKGNLKQSKTHNLLMRLWRDADSFLRFTTDPNAVFDNNLAERSLRMNKVKMKVSGCYRSFEAAEEFMNVRSLVATARKQGKCAMEMIVSLFTPQDEKYLELLLTPE